MLSKTSSRWTCHCRTGGADGPCRIPPSPEVMAETFMEYRNSDQFGKLTFKKYLEYIGFVDPAASTVGMDDADGFMRAPTGLELIAIPSRPVMGELRVKVLLVEFPDRRGIKPPQHYQDMLFSQSLFPTGSMRDYYTEVSGGKVTVTGEVHGWLMMPHRYEHYTNGESGTRWESYPHNTPRLAEDAVNAALAAGVSFDKRLDKFEQGVITALFIVHAGRGAEVMPKSRRGHEIWSHKWIFRNPIDLPSGLTATTYLVVPNDCKLGVCAHELGHLAFQWQDFYDPNYNEDGMEWDGTGVWDLMAGGSYNGDGSRPAHPAALHKLQHGWIAATKVTASTALTIKPYSSAGGSICKIVSPAYKRKGNRDRQYLLLENRKRQGFDFDLPGEGLLVWKVDEISEQNSPNEPGLTLVQADGRGDLETPDDWNQGDADDPFPGGGGHTTLGDVGATSTSFNEASGVSLTNIAIDSAGNVKLNVVFAAAGQTVAVNTTATSVKSKNKGQAKPERSTRATVRATTGAASARRNPVTTAAKSPIAAGSGNALGHSDGQREVFRVAFAKHRRSGASIRISSQEAGIASSTFYAWNKGDDWSKQGGWSKGDGSSK